MYLFINLSEPAIKILKAAFEIYNSFMENGFQLLTESPDVIFGGYLWAAIELIIYCVQGIGYVLLVMFAYAGYIHTGLTFAEFKRPAVFLNFFVRCALTKMAIDYGPTLYLLIFKIFIGIIQNMLSAVGGIYNSNGFNTYCSIEMSDKIKDIISECDWEESLVYCIIAILTWAVFLVLSLQIVLVVYGRLFKIMMISAVSPLAIPTFMAKSFSIVGASYVKSFFGVCAEGLVIALCCIIFNIYVGTMGQEYLDNSFNTISADLPCFSVWENNGDVFVAWGDSYDDHEVMIHEALFDKYLTYKDSDKSTYQMNVYTFSNSETEKKEQLISEVEACTYVVTNDGAMKDVLMYLGRCIFMMLILAGTMKGAEALSNKWFGL